MPAGRNRTFDHQMLREAIASIDHTGPRASHDARTLLRYAVFFKLYMWQACPRPSRDHNNLTKDLVIRPHSPDAAPPAYGSSHLMSSTLLQYHQPTSSTLPGYHQLPASTSNKTVAPKTKDHAHNVIPPTPPPTPALPSTLLPPSIDREYQTLPNLHLHFNPYHYQQFRDHH